jgi:hypothetical protein
MIVDGRIEAEQRDTLPHTHTPTHTDTYTLTHTHTHTWDVTV